MIDACLTPVKFLADMNRRVLAESTSRDFTFLYVDISAVNSSGKIDLPDDSTQFAAAPSRARRLAPPGSVVISTVRTYLRAIAAVPPTTGLPLVFSTGFAVLEPKGVEPRYLSYACQSDAFVDQVVARSVGVSYPAIGPSELATICIPAPPVDEQRRIADFLDDQVARIDNIVAARQDQVELLDRGLTSALERIILSGPKVQARRYLREAVVGIVVQPSRYYVEADSGVPALRGLNVSERWLSVDNLVNISAEGHALHPRSRLTPGDIVVVRTGDAGSAAVVPDWADGWNAIDLVILRASANANPKYLMHALNASRRSQAVASASSGSIQQHFGVNAITHLPVVWRDPSEQSVAIAQADSAYDRRDSGAASLTASVRLYEELKRSLITAAVTGKLDVSAADGSRVPA